ncbi:hypothetical protein ScPMuIL_000818 [Solemya velum]
MANVAVLGAGAVGLSTALCVQQGVPGVRVTVIADKFTVDTTSDGAAGIIAPMHDLVRTKTYEEIRKYIEDSFAWYDSLCKSAEGPEAGIQRISGYDLLPEREQLPLLRDILYQFRELTEKELDSFPDDVRYGWFYTTLMVECRRYLPWLMRRFRDNGGMLITKYINALNDIPCDYDVVVNCLGLGSREVFNDPETYPIRGHVLRVKAPWMKHFMRVARGPGTEAYVFPGQDNVVLGGTYEKNEYDTQNYKTEIFDQIVDRVAKYVPGMKYAPIERRWVGLRPCRSELRVEKESYNINGQTIKVVHNYGHGHQGILLSWGTALRATELVKECLSGGSHRQHTKSKL